MNSVHLIGSVYAMSIVERREREKEHMRRLILDTAMKLFIEEGYENVSIRRIAEKIEYSPATIYLYYKDKDEILYRLHEDGFTELIKRQKTTLSIKQPLERLHRLCEIYISFALKNREYYNLMFIMKAPMRKLNKEWPCGYDSYKILRQTVEECIQAGKLPAANLDAATIAMWSFVHGFASLIIRGRLRMVPEEQLSAIIKEVMEFNRKLQG